ncbi:MAG: SH3 domain-containing protein, partial [Clostridium sp.]|nr:SH3 domain-containing protein [Clostridium sp.]
MKKKQSILLLFLMVLSILFQSVGVEVLAAPGDQYIATGNVNFRSGPSTSYDKIDYILKGSQVEHISHYNSYWEKIRFNGREGYASSKYFKPISVAGDSTQEYITTVNINFRTGPSTSYASQGIVPKGTPVE